MHVCTVHLLNHTWHILLVYGMHLPESFLDLQQNMTGTGTVGPVQCMHVSRWAPSCRRQLT